MFHYTLRRLLFAIPTLLVISFIIFALLDLSPGDPTANLPLTIPAEVREQIRVRLGLGEPFHIRYLKWLDAVLRQRAPEPDRGHDRLDDRRRQPAPGHQLADALAGRRPHPRAACRRRSGWSGSPISSAILIAVPIGVISAYRQYSWFDQIGTFVSMIGFSVPTFFMGLLLIVIFSVKLQWLPSIYDTNLRVTDLHTFWLQVKQMIMPVTVLALFNASQISRYMRASMLDNLSQDYVRTARAKGLRERAVVLIHVLRNSLIPVVTVIALGVPTIFGGAIITEQIFRVNGLGQLLITGIQGADLPLVQTLTFMFAVLIVLFNLIADVLYGILDPRIRYD